MKSRKLVIYQDKEKGSIFVRTTKEKDGKFVIESSDKGKAVSEGISEKELGQLIKEKLNQINLEEE